MTRARIAVAALSLSAAALVAIWGDEGWTEQAIVPVKGDVPTYGPGLTHRPDGSPVRMGDTIKPLPAARLSLQHLQGDERNLKACLAAPLHQAEYDLLVDHAYQYGVKTTCSSSMVRLANAGRYREACEAYLAYRLMAGRDCSAAGSGCRGVWLRSQGRRDRCVAAQ